MKRVTIFGVMLFCAAVGAQESSASSPSPLRFSAGVGGSFAANFGGGMTWENPPVEQITMPYFAGGGYLFFDAHYAEISVGYYAGSGKWESPNVSDVRNLPTLSRSVVNLGILAKYPIEVGTLTLFPLVGLDYDIPLSGNLQFAGGLAGATESSVDDLAALWLRVGGGVDMGFGGNIYLRVSLLYGIRTTSALEDNYVTAIKNNLGHHDVSANVGHGLSVRAGVGYKF